MRIVTKEEHLENIGFNKDLKKENKNKATKINVEIY